MSDDKHWWIELIRVRSSQATLNEALPKLRQQVDEIDAAVPEAETFVMQHAVYVGDLAVAVVWQNGIDPQKTPGGLMVAERMRQLGPVDHAVWIPANGMKR